MHLAIDSSVLFVATAATAVAVLDAFVVYLVAKEMFRDAWDRLAGY